MDYQLCRCSREKQLLYDHTVSKRPTHVNTVLWLYLFVTLCHQITNLHKTLQLTHPIVGYPFRIPIGTTSYCFSHIGQRQKTNDAPWCGQILWLWTLFCFKQYHYCIHHRDSALRFLVSVDWISILHRTFLRVWFKTIQWGYVKNLHLYLELLTVDTVIFLVMNQPLNYVIHDFNLWNKWCSIIVVISIFLTVS